MKYANYTKLAENLTGENALDVCKALLEQARTDSVEYDAEIAKLNKEIADGVSKYQDLQVDYIKKFSTVSAEVKKEPEHDTDNLTEEEATEAITQTLQEVL